MYEYRGLMAQTWDILRGDPSGRDDREFYFDMIGKYGQPVLDVGCGTGRLLLDFLAAGIDIEGVDVSPEMLQFCREKGGRRGFVPTLYEQSIVELTLSRRYQTILASSSVLQLITEVGAVRLAIANLFACLGSGGALIAPFMTLWHEGMPLQREWENAQPRTEDGAMLQRMGRVWYDPVSQCEHSEDLYQVMMDEKVIAVEHHMRSPASRSYSQSQAHNLFEEAGFGEIHMLRAFTQMTAGADDKVFTVIGTKS